MPFRPSQFLKVLANKFTKPPNIVSNTIDYQIILDRSSIEVFLNGGVYSLNKFSDQTLRKLTLISKDNQEIKDFSIHFIESIWLKKQNQIKTNQ
jgi:fructan beta-fructosidase